MDLSSTREFYLKEKNSKEGMLDEVTLSHMFRKENSFTSEGLSYGELLSLFLKERCALSQNSIVVEIGPGLGDVASSISSYLKGALDAYISVDISKSMILEAAKKTDAIIADCMNLPFKNESINLLIANEVLADLDAVIGFSMQDARGTDIERILAEYEIDVPDGENFNYGAIRFIEAIYPLIAPGGCAFIMEHSCKSGFPERITVKGHEEFSIKFSHLKKAAESVGFSALLGNVNEILKADKDKKFICGILRPDINEALLPSEAMGKLYDAMTCALTPDEFVQKLVESGEFNIFNIGKYAEFIRASARPLGDLLDKFEFMLLFKEG